MRDHTGSATRTGLLLLSVMLVFLAPCQAFAQNVVKVRSPVLVAGGTRVDSAVAIGGDVRVDGSVKDDVVAMGGSVFLGPRAEVGGNVVSLGGTVTRFQGSRVDGQVTEVDMSRAFTFVSPFSSDWWTWPSGIFSFSGIVPLVGFLVLTLLVALLAPRLVESISSAIETAPVSTFFWGVLGSMAVFPVAFLLLVSIIGMVLIPFELLLAGVGFFLGYVAVVRTMGKKLLEAAGVKTRPLVLETLLGMVVFWLVCQVPLIGWLILYLTMIVGFGGVLVSLFRRAALGSRPAAPA